MQGRVLVLKESLTVGYSLAAVPLVSGIGPGVVMILSLGDSLTSAESETHEHISRPCTPLPEVLET